MSNKEADILDIENDMYVAVPVSSLIHRKSSIADLYLRLPSGNMIKIARKGGAIEADRIKQYGNKDVKYFYILREELTVVVSDLVRASSTLNKMENIPAELKVAKFFSVSESVYTELLSMPINEEALSHALTIGQELNKNFTQKTEFEKLFLLVADQNEYFTRHSIGTVIITNLIAKYLGWSSPKILYHLTMGAFLHDIGKKEIPKELHTKKRADMTAEEITIYESHPIRGVNILNQFPQIPAEVLQIVLQHHEIPNGHGYPNRLRGERIYPLAKVVSLANQLSHDLFDEGPSGEKINFENVLLKIDTLYTTIYGSELAKAMLQAFQPAEAKLKK